MGRPRKDAQQSSEVTVGTSEAEFTHTALGTCEISGVKYIIKVGFNPETGETGNLVREACGSSSEVNESFKINAIKLGLVK